MSTVRRYVSENENNDNNNNNNTKLRSQVLNNNNNNNNNYENLDEDSSPLLNRLKYRNSTIITITIIKQKQ